MLYGRRKRSNHWISTRGLAQGRAWELLQHELNELGRHSIAVDLPIDDPHATFDDYARVVVDALRDEPDIMLVGHSRAGNVLPRVAGLLAVQKLVYLCASFEPSTVAPLRPVARDGIPAKNSDTFLQGIKTIGGELTVFDRELARKLYLVTAANRCKIGQRNYCGLNGDHLMSRN